MNHVTQVKRAMRDMLAASLPGKLAEADAALADGITTDPPFEIYTTDKADIGGMPSIELIVTESAPQDDSFADTYRHRIVVGVSVGGDDEETITAQLERYIWAIRVLVKDAQLSPSTGTAPADVGVEQYTPLVQRPQTVENPLVKGVFMETFVTTVE